MTNILVIDPNIAFSTLLTEELDRQNYDVEAAFDFDEALAFARAQSFELALVDMGVNEPGGLELAQRLREEQPELRLMLIPLLGEELPDEVRQALPIQGVLPKPFFLPELPERIEKALQASLDAEPGVAEPESPVSAAQEAAAAGGDSLAAEAAESVENTGPISARIVNQRRDEIERLMQGLVYDVGADLVLFNWAVA